MSEFDITGENACGGLRYAGSICICGICISPAGIEQNKKPGITLEVGSKEWRITVENKKHEYEIKKIEDTDKSVMGFGRKTFLKIPPTSANNSEPAPSLSGQSKSHDPRSPTVTE